MRNRKLLITVLIMAVFLVCFVLLLKQTGTQNDNSLANNGNKPKTEKPAQKAPQAKATDPNQTKPTRAGQIVNGAKPITIKPVNSAQKIQPAAKPAFNEAKWKAQEIRKVKAEIQQTTNSAYKAKLQKRLNSLQ